VHTSVLSTSHCVSFSLYHVLFLFSFFFLLLRLPPRSTLFPYTTLFRSSRVPFTARLGKPQPIEMFSDGIESGESKWTHGSGIRKKKLRVDTWTISSKRVHSGTSSWFTPDPGDKVTDAHLDTLPMQIPADARNWQLVFFQ